MENEHIAMQHSVVEEARTWIGTRFLHQGRRKKTGADKGGVDCLGLLMGVAQVLALKDKYGQLFIHHDSLDYSKQPSAARLSGDLEKALVRAASCSEMRVGDVALLEMDSNAQHLAIISDYGAVEYGLIHAYAPCKKVIEHHLDGFWYAKIREIYHLVLK